MKKIQFFTICAFIFFSCKDVNDTVDNFGFHSELIIENLELKLAQVYWDSAASEILSTIINEATKDTITYSDIWFEISIGNFYYLSTQNTSYQSDIPTARPRPEFPSSANVPVDIAITSDTIFHTMGHSYLPGENLSNIFEVHNYDWENWITVQQSLDNFSMWDPESFWVMRMKSKPDSIFNQKFKFEVTLKDERTFTLTTPELIIK